MNRPNKLECYITLCWKGLHGKPSRLLRPFIDCEENECCKFSSLFFHTGLDFAKFMDQLSVWENSSPKSEWRSFIFKHNVRWLHISRLKASALYYSFWKTYYVNKMHRLRPGKGAGIWWVMEPHWLCTQLLKSWLKTIYIFLYFSYEGLVLKKPIFSSPQSW